MKPSIDIAPEVEDRMELTYFIKVDEIRKMLINFKIIERSETW